MASNPDFLKAVFDDVELLWPRLDQTYKFNHQKKETEPAPPTAQNASWNVTVALTKERAEKFRQRAEEHYNECRVRNSSLPEFSGVFGMKEKDGQFSIVAKRNGVNGKGEVNEPPRVVDEYHEDLRDRAIWSGSRGSVSILAHPSTNPTNGEGGISLVLRNVLVTEVKYGGDGLVDDFGEPKKRSASDMRDTTENFENPGHGMEDPLSDDIPF